MTQSTMVIFVFLRELKAFFLFIEPDWKFSVNRISFKLYVIAKFLRNLGLDLISIHHSRAMTRCPLGQRLWHFSLLKRNQNQRHFVEIDILSWKISENLFLNRFAVDEDVNSEILKVCHLKNPLIDFGLENGSYFIILNMLSLMFWSPALQTLISVSHLL